MATYFPSRMSYNTMQSSSLLDIAFSPFGLKSTQLTFWEFLRYVLATLKLRNTLSVILMSAATVFSHETYNVKPHLVEQCMSNIILDPWQEINAYIFRKTNDNKIRSRMLFTTYNNRVSWSDINAFILISSSPKLAVFSNHHCI